MTTYDPAPVLDALRPHHLSGGYPQWKARCPAHEDRHASLSFGVSDNQGKFNCHAGCGRLDILDALGLKTSDLYPPRDQGFTWERRPWMPCMWDDNRRPMPGHEVKAEYEYRDQHGTVIRGVSRCVQKCFSQWRPDPARRSGRAWSTKLDKSDPTTEVGADLIYRLPEILAELGRPWEAQRNIWVVEGEKDADRLWSVGCPATTNPQGADGWNAGHAAWLHGADVMVATDRDDAGWRRAETVVNTLLPIARSIEVVRALVGKDISDHLDAEVPLGPKWLQFDSSRDYSGHPKRRLGLRDLVTVAEPLPAPHGIPGCFDCIDEDVAV